MQRTKKMTKADGFLTLTDSYDLKKYLRKHKSFVGPKIERPTKLQAIYNKTIITGKHKILASEEGHLRYCSVNS